jgi:hypothetical protein
VRSQLISGNEGHDNHGRGEKVSDPKVKEIGIERCERLRRDEVPAHKEAQLWEVPVHLRGRQVQLRYEPFQWSVLEVWYQEKFAGLGRRCDKNLNAKTYGSADYER